MSSESLVSDNGGVNQPSVTGNDPKSSKPWKYLSRFELTCQGREKVRCPVYANGRQQIPVEIIIEARDEDGVVVSIPTDYASLKLRLCEYNDEEAFPYRVGEAYVEDPKYVYEWQAQKLSNENERECATHESAALSAGVQVVRRWLYTDVVHSRKLAVRCTSPDGVVFVTNTPNPPEGKFDSWVIIDAKPPKTIHWQQFSISAPKQVVNNNDWQVMLYYIYFTDPNLKIVDSVNYQTLVRGCHFTMNQLPDWRVDQIAFVVGPQVSYLHRSCTSNERNITFTINDRDGHATAAHISDKTTKFCGYGTIKNGLMGYIDQYGNESKITLKAVNDGSYLGIGGAMRLDDPANVHDEWPNRP